MSHHRLGRVIAVANEKRHPLGLRCDPKCLIAMSGKEPRLLVAVLPGLFNRLEPNGPCPLNGSRGVLAMTGEFDLARPGSNLLRLRSNNVPVRRGQAEVP